MIRLAVVEDDPFYAKTLQEYLDQYQEENKRKFDIHFFQDGEDIIDDYQSDFDIILMDIQMRFMDGMTAARLIREKDENVTIMFITNMTSYAIKGYEVDAMDYILKPVNYPTFSRKLTRALRHRDREEDHFVLIPVQEGARRVQASQIYYIESQGHTMKFHTVSELIEGKGRMDDLEKELSPYGFFRSNKWFLVNMHYVKGIQDDACLIAGEQLQISRRRRAAFLEQLSKTI